MGDIEHVFHWGSPHTIEEYVQEIGRVGQNLEPCHATLTYKNPVADPDF